MARVSISIAEHDPDIGFEAQFSNENPNRPKKHYFELHDDGTIEKIDNDKSVNIADLFTEDFQVSLNSDLEEILEAKFLSKENRNRVEVNCLGEHQSLSRMLAAVMIDEHSCKSKKR